MRGCGVTEIALRQAARSLFTKPRTNGDDLPTLALAKQNRRVKLSTFTRRDCLSRYKPAALPSPHQAEL